MAKLTPAISRNSTTGFRQLWFVVLGFAFAVGVFAPWHGARAAFPTTSIIDDFNRGSLGSDWTHPLLSSNPDTLQISSNAVAGLAAGIGYADGYYNAATYGPDSEVYATIPVEGSAGSTGGVELYLRMTEMDGTPSGYSLWGNHNKNGTWYIYRYDNNVTPSQLGGTITQALSDGDAVGLSMIGSTLQAYYKPAGGSWTVMGSSRSDGTYSDAGYLGIAIQGSSAGTRHTADDFGGGTVVTAGTGSVQVSSRSDTLSDSQPSATSNHTFSFKVNTSLDTTSPTATDTLTLTLASGFNLNNIYCKDVDFTIGGTATSIAGTFASRATSKNCPGSATSWGLFIDPVATTITFYTPTGVRTWVNAGTQLSIKVGTNTSFQDTGTAQIVNPSSPGTYAISVGGTFGGSGNIPVSINAGFEVAATVAESLSLTVSPSVSSVQMLHAPRTGTASPLAVDATGSGNLLVLSSAWSAQNLYITGVTDNAPGGTNTWYPTNATGTFNNDGTGSVDMWYAKNSKPGATSLAITTNGSQGRYVFREFSGVDTASPLDAIGVLNNQNTSLSPTGSVMTTAQPGELIISNAVVKNSITGIYAGNAFTNDSTYNGDGWAHLVAKSTGTYQAQWSQDVAGGYTANTVSFKAAANCLADDGATVNVVGTTANTVLFDVNLPNTFYQGCHDVTVSTNGGGGYVLTAQETNAMQTASGGYTIPDTTCDTGTCTPGVAASWLDPTKNGFGHTCWNKTGNDCAGAYANGTKFRPFASGSAGNGGIEFVQSASSVNGSTDHASKAFPSNNTAGDLLVVAVAWNTTNDTNTGAVADSQGNNYYSAVLGEHQSNGYNKVQIFYAPNAKPGANTVTVNLSNPANDYLNIYIHEYSGIATVSPLDKAHTNDNGTGTTADSGNTALTAQPDELLFGFAVSLSGVTGAGTNYTLRLKTPVNGSIASGATEDRIVNATGTYNATFPVTNGVWIADIATFKGAGSAGAVLMASSTPAIATGRVKYRISVAPLQAAGTYTTIIDYIITATY